MNENAYFKLTREEVTKIISDLRAAAERLHGNIENVDDAITGRLIPTNWRGEAADSYRNAFGKLRDGALTRFHKFLSSYADAIELALNNANVSEQEISQYATGLESLD